MLELPPIPYKGHKIHIHNETHKHKHLFPYLYECEKLKISSWSLARMKEAIRKIGFKTYELSELLTNSK